MQEKKKMPPLYQHLVTIKTPVYGIGHTISIDTYSVIDALFLVQRAYPTCKITDVSLVQNPEQVGLDVVDARNASPLTDGEAIYDMSLIK